MPPLRIPLTTEAIEQKAPNLPHPSSHATPSPAFSLSHVSLWSTLVLPPHDASAALRLRDALVPYIYTAGRDAADTGVSLLRPLHHGWMVVGLHVSGALKNSQTTTTRAISFCLFDVVFPLRHRRARAGRYLPHHLCILAV